MRDIDFFSCGNYLALPTKSNPKVLLNVATGDISKNSFLLYNPFSLKAKFLKNITKFLFVKFSYIFHNKITTESKQKSEFVLFLEAKLGKEITTSIYNATAKDKVVLQLQSKKVILGYLKFPLNEIARNRILKEKKAIEIFSNLNIVQNYLLFDTYQRSSFIFLNEISGKTQVFDNNEIYPVLNKLKKTKQYTLIDHPRILNLKRKCKNENSLEFLSILDAVGVRSKELYSEVYEHGDFAPWNLMLSSGGIVPFDFEYFEEEGLEFLDLIKYHYQIETLLNKKSGLPLIRELIVKTEIIEFDLLFQVFLIIEIFKKIEESLNFSFESELLMDCSHEKI